MRGGGACHPGRSPKVTQGRALPGPAEQELPTPPWASGPPGQRLKSRVVRGSVGPQVKAPGNSIKVLA